MLEVISAFINQHLCLAFTSSPARLFSSRGSWKSYFIKIALRVKLIHPAFRVFRLLAILKPVQWNLHWLMFQTIMRNISREIYVCLVLILYAPNRNLFTKTVNHLCWSALQKLLTARKMLHLRYLTGFWICLILTKRMITLITKRTLGPKRLLVKPFWLTSLWQWP